MKKIIITLLILTIVLSLSFSLFACDNTNNKDDNDGKVRYCITVNCADKLVLDTISVKIVDTNGNDVTKFGGLDTNRQAVFHAKPGTYKVVVVGALSDYEDVPETFVTPTSLYATVELVKKGSGILPTTKVEYNITLTLPNGEPVANKTVQLCTLASAGGTCVTAITNEDGIATFSLVPDIYEVHLWESEFPEGFTFDNALYTVTADVREITIQYVSAE